MNKINFKKKLLYIFFFFLLIVLLMEFFLKIMGIEYPVLQRHDPIRGFSLSPHSTGNWTREGNAKIKINSAGLRDIEHSFIKKKNTYRIAILGDSFAEARAVNIQDTFWFKLKNNLKNCKNNKFTNTEIINFGISEYGTTQQFLTLKHYVWKYDPDLILLAFFSGNDISDNSKKLSLKKYRPFFLYNNGNLVLDNNFKNTNSYKLLSSIHGQIFIKISKYSRLAQLLREAYVQSYFNSLKKNVEKKISKIDKESHLSNLYNPISKEWANAWIITEKIIELINNEILKKNKDFIVVSVSNPIQVHPDKKIINKYKEKNNIKNINYPDNRLEFFLNKNNIKYINTAKQLSNEALLNNTYFHGFENTKLGTGHWNKLGHSRASKIISSQICRFYN